MWQDISMHNIWLLLLIAPRVYRFPVFTKDFCHKLIEELEHIELSDAPKGRPNTMNNYGVKLQFSISPLSWSEQIWKSENQKSPLKYISDPPKWTWLWWGFHHSSPRALPEACVVTAVSWLRRQVPGQPQGLCGEIRNEWGPGPELPLWQCRGHPQCIPGKRVHWRKFIFWGHETGGCVV